MISRNFGYYLREKRHQLGLSQADIADKTKIQRTSISRLESHAGNPQWSLIRRIAEDGMGISVGEFFQVEPVEARQPLIHVGGDTPAPKLAEMMLKLQGKAVPIVTSETPLRSKVVTDQDISGYLVIDHQLLSGYQDKPLVGWLCGDDRPAQDWLLVDISNAEIKSGALSLVVVDDHAEPRRTWLTPKGALALSGSDPNTAPVIFWGRQKDRVEILGRVIMTAHSHLE